MNLLPYLLHFLAGALACNCIPHLAAGLRGEPFPSPLAKPPGQGHSSALVNTLWGSANLLAAFTLLSYWPLALAWSLHAVSFWAGFVLIGCGTARHFERVRKDKTM